ncbi:hypothetical protein MON38_17165 [Hymenobacter sp. DH14]|uniref:Uncharacterized protein n=1 Tax=Hymenobacter cyanobacteriorum TaxID=2926463 RepID=A0A9X2AGE5_9BACT|nr:hypothetical protein [Hymenobacter cyanobacteriorum]MCI1189156.1 hypothetical protein [Hymenobacter cyanobacteriorum]
MYFFILASAFSSVDTPSLEQTAFNYFASEVVAKRYPQAEHFYLTGQSEAEANISGPFWKCFPGTDFPAFWRSQHANGVAIVLIAYREFSLFKKSAVSKKGRLQVRIYRAVVGSDGASYTYIKVYKIHHFVDHYLIKIMGANNEIVDVCQENEII